MDDRNGTNLCSLWLKVDMFILFWEKWFQVKNEKWVWNEIVIIMSCWILTHMHTHT